MSKTELNFSSAECDIFYNEDLHIVQTLWKRVYFSEERFRNILDEIINVLESKHSSVIIADAREMFAISPENQEWILKSWYPRAVRAGFRYQGLILNKDSFSEMTVKQISKEYDSSTVITHYFSSPSESLDWVRELMDTGQMK